MNRTLNTVGVVAIGRNEGGRLRACVESIVTQQYRLVYVDSGSTDGSVAYARSVGVEVVELDMSLPFSAARARNAGCNRLVDLEPAMQYVQFIDADCILVEDWIEQSVGFLETHRDCAVACGRRRERFPQASLYNRLIDMEWDTPVGVANACGGDSLMRLTAFSAVQGFDPTVVAGEEPELCVRLRASGWRIMRLDFEMTLHDAAMTSFRQWWKRAIRTGYGGLGVYQNTAGQSARPFARQIRSARIWTIGWPLFLLSAVLGGGLIGGTNVGFALGAVVAMALPALVVRIAWRSMRRGTPFQIAWRYAMLIVIAKVPEMLGQLRWLREQRRGISATLIEHKPVGV